MDISDMDKAFSDAERVQATQPTVVPVSRSEREALEERAKQSARLAMQRTWDMYEPPECWWAGTIDPIGPKHT